MNSNTFSTLPTLSPINIPSFPIQSQVNVPMKIPQSQQTSNIPVHYIRNGQIDKVQMMSNLKLFGNIKINDFVHLERDDANNKVIGYKMEALNGINGPIVIKQYILFPNQC